MATGVDRDEESVPLIQTTKGIKLYGDGQNTADRSTRLNASWLIAFALTASLVFAVVRNVGYDGIKKSLSSLYTISVYNDEFNHPDDRVSTIVRVDFYIDPSLKYASMDEMSVIATNEYGRFDAPYPWMNEIEGTQLVEPFRDTQLELVGSVVASGQYTFQWNLTDYDVTLFNQKNALQMVRFR
jgi:hypothetical protein